MFELTNVTYSLLRWRSWSPSGREHKDECQMMLSDVILSIGAHSVALVKSEGLVGTKLMYNEGRFKELCFCMHSSGQTRSSMLCFPYLMRTWVGTWTTTSASFVTDPESTRVIRTSTSLTSCTVSVVVITVKPAFFQPVVSYHFWMTWTIPRGWSFSNQWVCVRVGPPLRLLQWWGGYMACVQHWGTGLHSDFDILRPYIRAERPDRGFSESLPHDWRKHNYEHDEYWWVRTVFFCLNRCNNYRKEWMKWLDVLKM